MPQPFSADMFSPTMVPITNISFATADQSVFQASIRQPEECILLIKAIRFVTRLTINSALSSPCIRTRYNMPPSACIHVIGEAMV